MLNYQRVYNYSIDQALSVTLFRQENRSLRHTFLRSPRGLCHWCVGVPWGLRPDIHHVYRNHIDFFCIYTFIYSSIRIKKMCRYINYIYIYISTQIIYILYIWMCMYLYIHICKCIYLFQSHDIPLINGLTLRFPLCEVGCLAWLRDTRRVQMYT